MSVIAIVFRNNQPCCSFWDVRNAANYAQRVSLNADSVRIQLVQLDLIPWEDTLYARQDNDELIWDGALTSEVDATTIYRIPLI